MNPEIEIFGVFLHWKLNSCPKIVTIFNFTNEAKRYRIMLL